MTLALNPGICNCECEPPSDECVFSTAQTRIMDKTTSFQNTYCTVTLSPNGWNSGVGPSTMLCTYSGVDGPTRTYMRQHTSDNWHCTIVLEYYSNENICTENWLYYRIELSNTSTGAWLIGQWDDVDGFVWTSNKTLGETCPILTITPYKACRLWDTEPPASVEVTIGGIDSAGGGMYSEKLCASLNTTKTCDLLTYETLDGWAITFEFANDYEHVVDAPFEWCRQLGFRQEQTTTSVTDCVNPESPCYVVAAALVTDIVCDPPSSSVIDQCQMKYIYPTNDYFTDLVIADWSQSDCLEDSPDFCDGTDMTAEVNE